MTVPESASGVVGVVLIGHGRTASELLAAAQGIVGPELLEGVRAVDAGVGETPKLGRELCDVVDLADTGAGVLLMVDLWGASPCSCAQRESVGHRVVILSGLSLAMVLKLAALDRQTLGPEALAAACADSARRSVAIQLPPTSPGTGTVEPVEPAAKETRA